MVNLKNKVVCITGLTGAGKSVVADFFVKNNFQYIRLGQITIDEIEKRNLPVNEDNERKIREEFRAKYGMAAYAILNLTKIESLIKKGHVIVDGLYSFEEYKVLKDKFGDALVVVTVYAPPRIRYERLSRRQERPLTIKEAQSRDFAEIENLNKGGTIAMADYTILNISDWKFLQKQTIKVKNDIIGK
ncbi:MAG TPA: AAA family ATPase [Candidatus Woesebacteria bacterium]|nr:AAA family ATPase [Candidatus Woesebacteria bacterium]HRS22728.1 AAA family ATPase [Candidatus Woesebacteria bacterium]HRT40293.1 AAA family ATPase [Candidatus Woesebacteria bacterium]